VILCLCPRLAVGVTYHVDGMVRGAIGLAGFSIRALDGVG